MGKDTHFVGCAIWRGGDCDCKDRDPEVFGGPDIEDALAEAQAEIERLRYILQRIIDEVELPQSIEQRTREALGDNA